MLILDACYNLRKELHGTFSKQVGCESRRNLGSNLKSVSNLGPIRVQSGQQVPGTRSLVPRTWYQAPGTRYLALEPDTWNQVPGTWYQVPGSFDLAHGTLQKYQLICPQRISRSPLLPPISMGSIIGCECVRVCGLSACCGQPNLRIGIGFCAGLNSRASLQLCVVCVHASDGWPLVCLELFELNLYCMWWVASCAP